MAISPIGPSGYTVTATQAVRPQQAVNEASKSNENKQVESEAPPPPPRPTVNERGETVGTRVNITA